MDNHLHREEVQQALSEGTGSSIRVSETDETERLYVAVRTTYQDETMVLRVSEPSTAFSTLSKSMQATTTIAIVVFCLIAAFVALFSIKQSAGPFRKLDQVKTDFVANASHELKTPSPAYASFPRRSAMPLKSTTRKASTCSSIASTTKPSACSDSSSTYSTFPSRGAFPIRPPAHRRRP